MKHERPIHRFAQQRLRWLRMPCSIRRTRAAASRLLHGVSLGAQPRTRIGAARITPIERVMRRCAVHVVARGSVTAHVMLSVGQRVDAAVRPRPADARPVVRLARPVPLRARPPALHERLVLVQRTLHERLLERLSVAAAPRAARHAATVVRVEHRGVYPRLPQMPMRAAIAPAAERVDRTAADTPPGVPQRKAPAEAMKPAASAAPLLAAQELARVTDHVIRQLDKRVLSYMERTGRA